MKKHCCLNEQSRTWAPALAHGALNAVAALPLLFLTGVDISIGGTLASAIGWISLALFVGWLVFTKRFPVKTVSPAVETDSAEV